MFGVVNYALLVLSIGCLTLAMPFEKKQLNFEHQITTEVIEQGAPCETTTKMGDDVRVKYTPITEYNNRPGSVNSMTFEYILGQSNRPGFNEALIGMCPGEIRRITIHYGSTSESGGQSYDVFDMELISIGDTDKRLPPEMDNNGDNVLDRAEIASYIASVFGDDTTEQDIDEAADDTIGHLDANGDGVIDYNEMSVVM